MDKSSERFGENARQALGDAPLRAALRRATDLFAQRRAAAIAQVPDWEALRDRARAIKDEVLADLERWLGAFAERARAAGAVLHQAADAAAACRIACDLARERGARTVVKSKSMTTEEIRLNDALAAAGCEVLETDLGEWIVQLAGETPSHIIVPAIHKSKAQIARLLAEKIGMAPTDDPAEMTAAARRFLRARFAAADMGVSGVNFAIAETGSILILENEGNARFTTTLPRVHVAVMGIEKVIPRFADLAVFLRLLPRSGTGQHLTSYQSILTGPKKRPEDEGPDELHIVLLDNGRRRLLQDPVARQTLACIRCGACLNACPVYQNVGGHAYGSVYPGPIGAVITPQLFGLGRAAQLPFASSLCGACREVCPVKIDIPAVLLHLRAQIVGAGSGRGVDVGAGMGAGELALDAHGVDASIPRAERRRERIGFWLWAKVVSGRRRFEIATALLRAAQRLATTGGRLRPWARPFAGPLRAWTADRDLRPLAARPFRAQWRDLRAEDQSSRSEADEKPRRSEGHS